MQISTVAKSASALLFILAATAYAQSPAFQGKWKGTATNAKGEKVQVQLTITKMAGKLRLAQSGGYVTRDECLDRDIPVAVTSQTESELMIDIKGDAALKGCINESATLKAVDAHTLEGTLKDGRTMKLTKK